MQKPGDSVRNKAAAAAASVALLLVLAGCAGLPAPVTPPALSDATTLKLQGPSIAAAQPVQWWRAFGDPQLDRLVEQSLTASPSLQQVQSRLERARANLDLARGGNPTLGASLDITRQRYSANGLYPPPIAGSIRESETLQLNGNWELDFFGKNRAALDAAIGSTNAAEADAQAARNLLAAGVVRAYLQLARNNDQLAVAQRALTQRQEALALVRDRVDAGLDSRLELTQSEAGLPQARQQIEALQEQAALAGNVLAALLGRPNEALTAKAPTLAMLSAPPAPDSVPADLLGARPDIAAARWRVEAAGQDVRNARAQFYPNINIVAFAWLSSFGLSRLFQSGSQQWGVGPAVRLPIFDAGRLRANLRGKNADLELAIASYNSAVVDAVHDVADQIASIQSIARQRTEQQQAQRSAQEAYDIALQRYKAGLGSYLNVLSAETTVLEQRRLAVDLAARALDSRALLMRALGGALPDERPSAAASTERTPS